MSTPLSKEKILETAKKSRIFLCRLLREHSNMPLKECVEAIKTAELGIPNGLDYEYNEEKLLSLFRVMTPAQKRVQDFIKSFKECIDAYGNNPAHLDFSDEVVILDMIYYIGHSLDNKFGTPKGAEIFKTELVALLQK